MAESYIPMMTPIAPRTFNGSFSKTVPKQTVTTVGTVTLPEGKWLLVSWMDLSASGSSVYAHLINNHTVRTTEAAGGGSTNAVYVGGGTYNISCYHGIAAGCTVRVTYFAIEILSPEYYSGLLAPPVTYTEGMWTVVKYDDGRAEVYGKKVFTNVTNAQWGTSGMYYIQLTPDPYPSGLFTSIDVAFAQSASTSDFITSARNQNYGGSTLSLTNPPQILGIRPNSTGTDTFTGMWHTIGRWK